MIEYICDGCGKREPADKGELRMVKPHAWFVRGDTKHGEQHACCRRCIALIAEKTGVSACVLPV